MGCLNQQLLPKFWAILLTRIDKWDGTHENEFGLVSDTKLNVINSYSGKSRWKKIGSFV